MNLFKFEKINNRRILTVFGIKISFKKRDKTDIPIEKLMLNNNNFQIDKTAKINFNNIKCKNTSKLKIGNMSIMEGNLVFDKEDSSISIGDRTFIGSGASVLAYENIEIGSDVLISWGCTIIDTNSHPIIFEERKNDVTQWYYGQKDWSNVVTKPIKIKDKVWIGFNSIILKGVTIGEGAVVGCGSVVTKDVEPYTIVAGNPAQKKKNIEK